MSTLGISFTRKVTKPAVGTTIGRRRSIAIGFDPPDFTTINAMAQKNDVGFQEQVRRLCRLALDIEGALAVTSGRTVTPMDRIRGVFSKTISGQPIDGWQRGHVSLALKNPSERVPVEAWRRGAFAIHEVAGGDGDVARLTHAPTGLGIYTFNTAGQAAECVKRIEPLADWESINKEMQSGSDLYHKVRPIIDEIAGSTVSSTERGTP